jgi:hypothetical protein
MQESKHLIEILERNNLNGFEKPGGTDKATTHSYTGVYEHLLSPYRNKAGSTLLEIGVQYGGSNILWQEFLSETNFYFVDITDLRHPSVVERLDPARSKFYQMDAYSDESKNLLVNECPAGFDIIIDDGPHTLESQMLCIKNFFPTLKEGGVMVIEDLQSFDWVHSLKQCVPTEYQDKIEVVDLRGMKDQYDDILFVIRK